MLEFAIAVFYSRGLGAKDGLKFLDWQLAQIRVYFVPLYENKKI